jgi:hypothetical protein
VQSDSCLICNLFCYIRCVEVCRAVALGMGNVRRNTNPIGGGLVHIEIHSGMLRSLLRFSQLPVHDPSQRPLRISIVSSYAQCCNGLYSAPRPSFYVCKRIFVGVDSIISLMQEFLSIYLGVKSSIRRSIRAMCIFVSSEIMLMRTEHIRDQAEYMTSEPGSRC